MTTDIASLKPNTAKKAFARSTSRTTIVRWSKRFSIACSIGCGRILSAWVKNAEPKGCKERTDCERISGDAMTTAIELVLREARPAGSEEHIVDIGIGDGCIVAIEAGLACDAPEHRLGGRLVVPGFVETHIHLDKSCISDRA